LESADLFDGPPERLVELVGPGDGWDVSKRFAPEGYFIVCHYKGTERKITFHVPENAKFCDFDGIRR
jgi:hypothetical protein